MPGYIRLENAVVRRLNGLVEAQPLGEVKIRGRKQLALAYDLLNLRPRV
ncbi:MAG: hypothetical protein HZC41_19030 [Chloroflexi bacterium]|nr:hypothetical protein [Chloroflexota bacterium]